jgi:hypothetical protein
MNDNSGTKHSTVGKIRMYLQIEHMHSDARFWKAIVEDIRIGTLVWNGME